MENDDNGVDEGTNDEGEDDSDENTESDDESDTGGGLGADQEFGDQLDLGIGDTAEAFTQTEVRAFGKFMWIAAIAYALKETAIDMQRIRDGRNVQFFRDYSFSMTYKDHLRLFLFIHDISKGLITR